jgi:hypothetical protein
VNPEEMESRFITLKFFGNNNSLSLSLSLSLYIDIPKPLSV